MKDEYKVHGNTLSPTLKLIVTLFNGMCVMLNKKKYIILQNGNSFELHSWDNYGPKGSKIGGSVHISNPDDLFSAWCWQTKLDFTYDGKPIFEQYVPLNIGTKLTSWDFPECEYEVINGLLNGQGRFLLNVTQKYVCNYQTKDLLTLNTLNEAAGENRFFLA